MSAKLMGLVFELDLGRDEFPIMIALADHARDDGTSVYPSIEYLAWKTNLSERSVQRVLRKLEGRGLIELVGNHGGGRGHVREYVIHVEKGDKKTPFAEWRRRRRMARKGDKVTPITLLKGDTGDAERVTPVTLKGDTGDAIQQGHLLRTVNEPSDEPQGSAPTAREEDVVASWHNTMFEEIYRVCTGRPYQPGQFVAPGYRGKVNAAIKGLPGVDPDEIASRAAEYRRQYPNTKLTPNALATHWDELTPAGRPPSEQNGHRPDTGQMYRDVTNEPLDWDKPTPIEDIERRRAEIQALRES